MPNVDLIVRAFLTNQPMEVNTTAVPTVFALSQNYPNPFNPSTKIAFHVPSSHFVSLKVFDVLGREIRTLVHEMLQAGKYQVTFDANALASGVYFYRLSVSFSATRDLVPT
ncbi:MAG: hypothetical protein C4326_15130, partial [Ignavibacteria bacterium]